MLLRDTARHGEIPGSGRAVELLLDDAATAWRVSGREEAATTVRKRRGGAGGEQNN